MRIWKKFHKKDVILFKSKFLLKNFPKRNKKTIFALRKDDSVAQLVEQMTLNHWVESSSLSRVTRKKKQLLFKQLLFLFFFVSK